MFFVRNMARASVFFIGHLHAVSLSKVTNDKICKIPEKKDWLSRMTLVQITCSSIVNWKEKPERVENTMCMVIRN